MPHAGDIFNRLETIPDGELSELAARYERLAAQQEVPHSRYAAIALRARVILFTRSDLGNQENNRGQNETQY